MTSLPSPPQTSSEPPRPRTSSSPFSPASASPFSVPESRPPFGQPGRSFVVKRPGRFTLIFRVPSHFASSEAVALGECVCSLLVASVRLCLFCWEASASTPEASAIRSKAHPIRKATTKAMQRPWRTTAPSPSLGMCPLLLVPRSMPHNEPWRISKGLIHRSAWKRSSRKSISGILHSPGPIGPESPRSVPTRRGSPHYILWWWMLMHFCEWQHRHHEQRCYLFMSLGEWRTVLSICQ